MSDRPEGPILSRADLIPCSSLCALCASVVSSLLSSSLQYPRRYHRTAKGASHHAHEPYPSCPCCRSCWAFRRLHSAEESMKYPETRKGEVADTLPRHAGPRPLPLARRRRPHLQGGRRLGRGREQAHLRLPRKDPVPQADPEAPHRAVELRAPERPVQGGRAILLLPQQRPTEPVGPLRERTARRQGARPARPEQADQGRHRRHDLDRGQPRRQAARLRPRRGRLRLAELQGHGRGHRQGPRRAGQVDQVQRRVVDARQQGLLLQPIRRAQDRRRPSRR